MQAAWLVVGLVAGLAACTSGAGVRFQHSHYNLSIQENSPGRTYAAQPPDEDPLGVHLPAGNYTVRFRIRTGDKEKFFKTEERIIGDFCFLWIRTRTGHSDVLNRERRDSYQLEVRATAVREGDPGPPLEADVSVAVTVSDVNDLGPLFYPTEYAVEVPEDAAVYSSIARVTAEDADLGINGEIYYSLEEPSDQFAVHPTSGVVSLTRPLQRAERARHALVVVACDRGSLLPGAPPSSAARAPLTVTVRAVNLHAPEIHVTHLTEIVENTSDEIYAIIKVIDKDSGLHGKIDSLDIVSGDPDGHFRVRAAAEAGQYDLVVHTLLDRERAPRGYNLTLRAQDGGQPPRQSYLVVPVTLMDVNDNAPVFSREVYEVSVPETSPPSTPVIRLKVSDPDQGKNAEVYIEIVGGNEGGEFTVNPDTGMLYTAVTLDAEERSFYTLTVSAIDQGDAGARKQSSAKVKINVIDTNDNDPIFESETMEVTVQENGPSGVVVARVSARDADSGENAYISYSLANLQPAPFEVDHFTGAVRTTRLLDYESMRRQYSLRVRASDWGQPYRRQAEMTLLVKLEDVNDNRPQFEKIDCSGYLPRYLEVGTEIITLSAIDFDAGNIISYRVVSGNEDNCFHLDSTSGVVSLACDLSDVRVETRVLNVTATDGTHFADTTSLTLHLAGAGAAGAAGALDCRDTGITRRLTDLLAAAQRSNADPEAAEDFPLIPSRYGQNVHVPEFVDFPVEIKVNESVSLGTSLVKLRARDRDLGYNGHLVYGISGGDIDSAFRIDPDSGELKVIGYLDREREIEYYLNITVYDLGKPQKSSSRLLPVTVLDENDNVPVFEKSLASYRVTENALNGTVIFRANASDRDSGEFGRVTYSIEGAGAGEFCVGPQDGVVRVCGVLDRERRALYELALVAEDGGGAQGRAGLRVLVDDVNDCAPRFPLSVYSARLREDEPPGTLVAALQAEDADLGAGGTLRYELVQGGEAFAVDALSGALRTTRRLDYEEQQVYGVTVAAVDGGGLRGSASVLVELADVDENVHVPTFTARVLAGSVRENSPPATLVLRAAARDADPPGRDSRLAYYLLAGSGLAYFSIDDAGDIRTLVELDRETAPHYWLTVCAQDHGLVPKHACVQVFVAVEDENDMVPWTVQAAYYARVEEHSGAGQRVAIVRAVDDDATPAMLRYRLAAGNPDGLFSINETTGEIVTTGRVLDREAASSLWLEVRVSDGQLWSSARVLVELSDINDHAPAFLEPRYSLRVPLPDSLIPQSDAAISDEDDLEREPADVDPAAVTSADDADDARWLSSSEPPSPTDLYLGTVLAVDNDAGENGTVRYSLKARGVARGSVRVEAHSGRLYAHASLHVASFYELTVRACDGGRPARCGTTRVSLQTVVGGGGADGGAGGGPVVPQLAPLTVTELDPPGYLLAVLPRDTEAPLYYDIIEGDPRREFVVGRESGALQLARRLQWERQPGYALNVSVCDGSRCSYVTVNVTVINDMHEEGVRFSRTEYAVSVAASAAAGRALLTLQARGRGHLVYGLAAARGGRSSLRQFRLEEGGVLRLATTLTGARHELTAWVRDVAPRAARHYARVVVTVLPSDDHAPQWPRRLAVAHIPADAPIGSLVSKLRAADRDGGEAGRVLYSLTGGGGVFRVHPALGDVTLAARPPAAPREYTLLVRASNPPPSVRHSTLPLHVTLAAAARSPPVFTAREVSAAVSEGRRGAVVARLEAASDTAVWYELRDHHAAFSLSPQAGVLTTARALDYETASLYNLTVRATNMGGGAAECAVVVQVRDVNEHAPRLLRALYEGRVSEDATPPAPVWLADLDAPLVLDTLDADSPAHRQRAFHILDAQAAAHFALDATTGALTLISRLDFETKPLYMFTVKVVDMGTPRLGGDSTATVRVRVLDVNDEAPVFPQPTYEATLLRPSARGVLALTVRAADPDLPAGSNLSYAIVDGDDGRVFAVDSDGGIHVASDDSLADEYRLRVSASDGLHAGDARVRIRVRDADNSGLVFQKTDYYGSVVENTTKPTTVAVLSVLGTSLDEHLDFRILNPNSMFVIGPTSGAVRSTGSVFDRERQEAYTLLVEARGPGGGRVARARLHVSVSDINDNCPVFLELPYAGGVLAGAAAGTRVGQVRALDADAGDNGDVRYEMKRGHGELFRVDRRSGLVTLRQPLEPRDQLYRLVVAAFDGGTPACGAEAELTVRVWAGGAAPRWERAHHVLVVREDAPREAPLGVLRALSPLQRPLIYTLHRQDTPDLFYLNFETAPDRGGYPCALMLRDTLDYEVAREHALVIRATDGVTGAHADTDVTLHVQDANDCTPRLALDQYRAAVSEAATPGRAVLALYAHDNDTGLNGEIDYSILSENGINGSTYFSIRARDDGGADVVVTRALDRERRAEYRLLVAAKDRGRPALSSLAHVWLTVQDVNDCAPVAERGVLAAAVSGEARRGTAVARVAAVDPDSGDAGRLQYALAAGDDAHVFAVDASTGLVTLQEPLAWTAAARPLSLNVSISDGAHVTFVRVELTPAPTNAHSPHFPHVLYEAHAPENVTPPLLLTTVRALDEDAGAYGTIKYSIPSDVLRRTFAVDERSGALSTRVPLDRELRAEWTVPVLALDGGGRAAHTEVRVRVSDRDDCAPRFLHHEYRATIPPDFELHRPFLTVYAVDADEGAGATLTYSIYDGEGSPARSLLAVDARSGAVSLARDAAPYDTQLVQVWVRAHDASGHGAEAALGVLISRSPGPLAAPQAEPPDYFLPENAPPGTVVAQAAAAEGAQFRLARGTWPDGLFSVDAAGTLVLGARLDRELAATHHIGVVVEGAGSPAPGGMWLLRLHVLDCNEHAPTLHSLPYRVTVAENTPPHTMLLRLMADDADAGSNGEVRFSLSEEDEARGLFALDSHSGWLSTRGVLDRERQAEHRLAVVASDAGAGRLSSSGSVLVRVLDYNDEPPVFSRRRYSAAVPEDALPGTVLLRLNISDADAEVAPVQFYIVDGDPSCQFQVRAGELSVAAALDRERTSTYELRVLVTDGKFSDTADLHVDVIDVNDNPPYCTRYEYTVWLPEDAPVGTSVVTVESSDLDEPQHARRRHVLSGAGADLFHIDKEDGRVTVAARLDREAVSEHKLTATVYDRARADWNCESRLLVRLSDVNDNAPTFSAAQYAAMLPEDAEPGTLVAKLHAADPDLGPDGRVRYSLLNDGRSTFAIAEDSGIVTLRAPLDRETLSSYQLQVHAADSGRPPMTATALLLVTVADVNDNPPEFQFKQYHARAPELDAVGTELVRVAATSLDTGVNAEVYYSIIGGDDRGTFAIDRTTGAISIAQPLDYEKTKEYFLTVQAVDGGSPPLSNVAAVNVTVVDCNDNAPVFAQPSYAARVREDASIGERVVQVIADDIDDGINARLTYSIEKGDRAGQFSVDADTGYVSVAAALDRETRASYVLELRARDRGLPSLESAVALTVEVIDANDNPPLFADTNYTAVVQEDRPLGHTILKLVVTDSDAPPNAAPYTFDFQSGNEMGAFRIEQDGYLRTAARFNHRVRDRYVLQVRVFDNGTPPLYSDAWVYVKVIEESHFPPVVTPLEIIVNSYLDEYPGGIIGRLYATDRDAYDQLTYSIVPIEGATYPTTSLFEIDAADGTLRALPRLDVGEYKVNVTVGDGKYVSHAVVTVGVLLISDEMLAEAIVVRFREVTAVDFVLSHRKGFVRAIRGAMDCRAEDVVIISVQASDESGGRARGRRQVARDLDVLFVVRGAAGEAVRRALHARLEALEESARLVVEELVRACGTGSGAGCSHGTCRERARLLAGARALAADVCALVVAPHRLEAACACEPGWAGARCELPAPALTPPTVAVFAGAGLLQYRVEPGAVHGARALDDELLLSLRLRTLHSHGTLAFAAGRIDYNILEVSEGFVQFRMELGSGEATARASVGVADGAWHEVRLERRGDGARLTVDRHVAHCRVPPPARVLDLRAPVLHVGAELQRLPAGEQRVRPFVGCLMDVRLAGSALPLDESEVGGAVQLVRREGVTGAPECPALPAPTACASYPCQNGGTCVSLGVLEEEWSCTCEARFLGRRCEVDAEPCASQPCLHGGECSPRAAPGAPYRCDCVRGLTGTRCQAGRWCRAGVCAHGGHCEEGEWGPTCRCHGYYGPLCQFDVDECAGEPCLNGATCVNEPGSFRCLCPPDKTGMNCGNPLSDAVLAGGAVGDVWTWLRRADWRLWAGAGGGALLLLGAGAVLACCGRAGRCGPAPRRAPPDVASKDPLQDVKRASKLSNLEAVRGGGGGGGGPCAHEAPHAHTRAPLNNIDTLRSYGSAGDELEGLPPHYLRNLNLEPEHKPWSEQMHLHTFTDNKIYNDLKGGRSKSPPPLDRRDNRLRGGGGEVGGVDARLVGGYHWDCSDWCAAAAGNITEVPHSERRDSSSPPLRNEEPSSCADDDDAFDASQYLLHPDEYLPRAAPVDHDVVSLLTIGERRSLLGRGSCSSLSHQLCEIEESDCEDEEDEEDVQEEAREGVRHTDV